MILVYDNGSLYSVSLGPQEIRWFRERWPASGLGGLKNLWAQFEKRSGDLVDLKCNHRHGSEDFDGEALKALVDDAQCYAATRLGIDEPRCADRSDWKEYLGEPLRKSRRK